MSDDTGDVQESIGNEGVTQSGAIDSLTKLRDVLSHNYTRYTLGGLFIILIPTFTGTFLAAEILLFSVFTLGYILLLGYTGEISFGHSAYIGAGAYATIIALHQVTANFYIAGLIGILSASILGAIFGALSLRRRGIYFAMITLALAQMFYYIVFQWKSITGGLNGISIPITTSASIGPFAPLSSSSDLYIAIAVLFVVLFAVVRRVLRSPYGRTVISIRENEERMRNLGYHTNRYLWTTFILSAAISGVAGVLYAALFAFVAPSVAYWTMSGEVVMMTLMGGMRTLGGAIVGAFLLTYLSDMLTVWTDEWRLFFGAAVIVLVLFAPQGVYGLYLDFVKGRISKLDTEDIIDQLKP